MISDKSSDCESSQTRKARGYWTWKGWNKGLSLHLTHLQQLASLELEHDAMELDIGGEGLYGLVVSVALHLLQI